MENDIINRVANSKLVTFDLEELYPSGKRFLFDIKEWLFEGLILREKEFRKFADDHDWAQYKDHYLALTCTTDAIVPGWAYMLLASKAQPFAQKVIVGDLITLESSIFQEILNGLDVSQFKDKPVIIKGCSTVPVPENAYLMAIEKLQPVAKSLMYGEACSSVPLYKRK